MAALTTITANSCRFLSYLRASSYPVISIDNSTFPQNVLLPEDFGETQYYVTSTTQFQPKEMPRIDVINARAGSWFAVAYITGDENDAIRQQGISHVCRYSLGSMASWSQEMNVHLMMPSTPVLIKDSPVMFK